MKIGARIGCEAVQWAVSDEMAAEVISAAKPRTLVGCYADHELVTFRVLSLILTMTSKRLEAHDTPTASHQGGKQPTFEEVRSLYDANKEFMRQLDGLQHVLQPPLLPKRSESGLTVWDSWLAGHLIGFEREDEMDRKMRFEEKSIRFLTCFYDEVMSERASHSDAGSNFEGSKPGPFARFIQKAFEVSVSVLPPGSAGEIQIPTARTLQHKIKKYRGDEETIADIRRWFSAMREKSGFV